jgi:predicted SnoaL-like aldol condensation-catalyzing enzyme
MKPPCSANTNANEPNLQARGSENLNWRFHLTKTKNYLHMKTIRLLILLALSLSLINCKSSVGNNDVDPAKTDSLTKIVNSYTNQREKIESNKRMVLEFYQKFFGDKDLSAADQFLGDTYIQHNPGAPNGREALKNLVGPMFKNAPKTKVDIRRVAADGDLVWLHIKGNFGGKEVSIVDIFRIENEKIVEHWDVIQEVPAKSANENTMF